MVYEVSIQERETGKEVRKYSISLGALNYVPSDKEYHSMAWRNAVEDGVVNDEDRDKYQFNIHR